MSDDTEFEGLADDLEGIVPDRLVDNTYRCTVRKSEIIKSKKNDKRYHLIEWSVKDDGPYYGEEITEMYRVAGRAEFQAADGDEMKAIKDARRKRIARLSSLGFKTDIESLKTIKPDDLVDTEAFLTVRVRQNKNGEWSTWIDNVELASSVAETIADF